jgi:uncharacterized membrane protein YjjB (DUF3815 family)
MSSVAGVLIFHGTWKESAILLGLGALNAVLLHFGTKYALNAQEVLVPFIIGLVSDVISYMVDEVCLGSMTLAALLPLFPGIAITLAMLEMAANNMQVRHHVSIPNGYH